MLECYARTDLKMKLLKRWIYFLQGNNTSLGFRIVKCNLNPDLEYQSCWMSALKNHIPVHFSIHCIELMPNFVD